MKASGDLKSIINTEYRSAGQRVRRRVLCYGPGRKSHAGVIMMCGNKKDDNSSVHVYVCYYNLDFIAFDDLFSKLAISCCTVSDEVKGFVARPSPVGGLDDRCTHQRLTDVQKLVMISHFGSTSSGVYGLSLGKQ